MLFVTKASEGSGKHILTHYDMSKKAIELRLSSLLYKKNESLVKGSRLALDNVKFAISAQI
jgi:hypothetical protein